MVIVMLVDGHGSLHESLFRAAVHQLVNAHPLLNARIQNCAGQLQWVAAAPRPDGSPSSVTMEWHVTDDGDPQTQLPLARPLNLHAGECLRLQVWTGSSAGAARWRMALEVHHACADGIAAVQLIAELLARYGRLSPDGTGIPSSTNVRRQPDFETPQPHRALPRVLPAVHLATSLASCVVCFCDVLCDWRAVTSWQPAVARILSTIRLSCCRL
jgi:NRPS condensation-like uncharacterized protein